MSDGPSQNRKYSARRIASGAMACPACRIRLDEPMDYCPACGFTGADTMRMFPLPLPPLQPVLDLAWLWNNSEISSIRARVRKLTKRFPQIRWAFCTVCLGEQEDPRTFGFWMLNASPMAADEHESHRAWTVLLLLDANSSRATVIPGYAVEPFVSDDQWMRALAAMKDAWSAGNHGRAVCDFLGAAGKLLKQGHYRVSALLKRKAAGS